MKLQSLCLALLASPALAISIDSIEAPPNMLRPVDDATYSFPVLLQATVNANEAANGASFDMYFVDSLPFGIAADGTIDGITLRVPAGRFQAGAQVVAALRMSVGCSTKVAGGETFGPLTGGGGTTGNAVTLGQFLLPGLGPVVPPFGATALYFGTNRVECMVGAMPSNGDRFEPMLPLNPPSPGLPMPSLPPPSRVLDFVAVVPEPSTTALWALGIAGLAWGVARRRR